MCNYAAPRQFAYIDPAGKFQRLKTMIENDKGMKACMRAIPYIAAYESVYGWAGWDGYKLTPGRSKHAIIDGIFLDFDDADDPQKAIRDAAEVAAYVGHCTGNFSGAKGAHLMIHCHVVDLIPDLKGHVIRTFVNNLVDVLPELDTLDFAVVGDTSRVRRIIDSVHPGTKLHAIGLTAEELSALTIDEIREKAKNRRGLIQVPEPSQWVTDELYRIEGEVLTKRFDRLYENKGISLQTLTTVIRDIDTPSERIKLYRFLDVVESEWRRIREEKAKNQIGIIMDRPIGRSPKETWLLQVVSIFKVVQRMNSIRPTESKVSTSPSEHEARCHIAHLMDDCGWDREQMHEVFSHADDYDRVKTDRQLNSLIGGR